MARYTSYKMFIDRNLVTRTMKFERVDSYKHLIMRLYHLSIAQIIFGLSWDCGNPTTDIQKPREDDIFADLIECTSRFLRSFRAPMLSKGNKVVDR